MPTVTKSSALPRGRLTRLDDNLLTVTAEAAHGTGEVRMIAAQLADSRLLFFGAVALNAAEVRALERFGTPSFLIVPSEAHREGAKSLQDRFPDLVTVAPAGVREKLEPTLRVDESFLDLVDATVSFVSLPGTERSHPALLVDTASGVTLVVDDLILKADERLGVGRWEVNANGASTRDSLIPAPPSAMAARDRANLRAQLLAWSQIENLNRIIVSRGDILTEGARHALIEIAATLAA